MGDRAGEGITYGNIGCVYHEQGDFANAIEYLAQDLAIAKEVGNRAGEGTAYGNLGTCHMHLNEYVKPSPTAKHIMLWQPRCSLHTCSLTQRSTWVSPSSFASAQLARALAQQLLLVLTKLLDRIVARRRRRAWMISSTRLRLVMTPHCILPQNHIVLKCLKLNCAQYGLF